MSDQPDRFLECQGCGQRLALKELECRWPEIPDLVERVEPGETVPYGECPNCGALVHEIKDE